MTFEELVEMLGERLGIEFEHVEGAAAVEIDGAAVILQDAGDLLLIRADVGEIPADTKASILLSAMEANFLYQGTGGATLAVDSRTGHLHLQKYNWLDRIDAEKAVTDLVRFADTVNAWKRIVAEAMLGASAAADDLSAPASSDFIQV